MKWFTMKAAAEDKGAPATISIHDEIGGWGVNARQFIDELKALGDVGEITLSINSPGGDVFDALAIYNALRNHPANVTTDILGIAASAASLVAMAGDKIKMPENAFLMIHNPASYVGGEADDMREVADMLDKVRDSIAGIYSARSGNSVEDCVAMMDATTYLTGTEAKAKGFADEVTPNASVSASFDLARFPENVRAAFKPAASAKPAETAEAAAQAAAAQAAAAAAAADKPTLSNREIVATFAEEVRAACEAAGLQAYAGHIALNAAGDVDRAEAAIDSAREVVAQCDVAGLKDRADALIRAGKSIEDARSELLAALVDADRATAVRGHQPQGKPAPRASAPVNTASIWAARRQPKKGE